MPELCRFYGIIIAMYYRDHEPAHFHAIYGDSEAIVNLETGDATGALPPKASRYVEKWRLLHLQELREAWALARARKPLPNLPPLE